MPTGENRAEGGNDARTGHGGSVGGDEADIQAKSSEKID